MCRMQELPVKPARQKPLNATWVYRGGARWWKESHTGESAYLTGKGSPDTRPLWPEACSISAVRIFPPVSCCTTTTNTGAVTGAQLIAPTGEKKAYRPAARWKARLCRSACYRLNHRYRWWLPEGYATARDGKPAHCRMRSGCHICGQPPNVAQSLRARWPEVKLSSPVITIFQDGGESRQSLCWTGGKICWRLDDAATGEIKADWNDFIGSMVLPVPVKPFATVWYCAGRPHATAPHGFRLTQNISGAEKQVQRNGETEIQNVKICSPLRVTAITCDADGGNFGRPLEWEDTWGERRRWAMPMEMLSGSGEELRRYRCWLTGLSYISTTGEARTPDGIYLTV